MGQNEWPIRRTICLSSESTWVIGIESMSRKAFIMLLSTTVTASEWEMIIGPSILLTFRKTGVYEVPTIKERFTKDKKIQHIVHSNFLKNCQHLWLDWSQSYEVTGVSLSHGILTATGSTATMKEANRKHATMLMLMDPIAPEMAKPYREPPQKKCWSCAISGTQGANVELKSGHIPTIRKLKMVP